MKSIKVFWGSDNRFYEQIRYIEEKSKYTLADVVSHINKTEFTINGAENINRPLEIENLVIGTDDYGAIKEWALMGFSVNILQNKKISVLNLYMNNPPIKIYEDVKKMYGNILEEQKFEYMPMSIEIIRQMVDSYQYKVLGQKNVIIRIVSSLYALKDKNRLQPVSILFLGASGVGKTETAKFISECLGNEMLRIQFSMQQTVEASKFIFGSEHNEDSLARELLRRKSNVILFDEFDKVHPSLYNAFYQMFDEGKFVDSNYSVSMEKAIIICTSNYVNEQEAEKKLGIPIYSRFSKVVKFDDISIKDRILIANKIYENLIKKLAQEDVSLIAGNKILDFFIEHIRTGSYKNIRMLKNDIEDAINNEILKKLNIIK